MTHDEAIEKVKKLLSLSTSDNPHEAALAASRAQEIMDRYQLETAMLDIDQDRASEPVKKYEEPLHAGQRLSAWRIRLAVAVGHANSCMIYLHGPSIKIVGRPSDASTVRYLFAYLGNEVDRLTWRDCKGEGKGYANNFRIGCVETIAERLEAAQEELTQTVKAEAAAQGSTALVRVEGALARREKDRQEVTEWVRQNMRLGASGRFRGGSWNSDARAAGRAAGNEVRLSRAKGALGA